MLTNVTEVTTETLLGAVAAKRAQGYRFVTMTCTDVGEAFDVLYHFDKDYVLENLRLKLAKNATLPSVCSAYFAAAVVENEIKDLFGIPVSGLAIDYEGKFLLSEGAPTAPFRKSAAQAAGADGKEGSGNG